MKFNYVKLLQQYAYWTMNRKKKQILNSINSTTTHLASYSLQSLTCYELCIDTNYCMIQPKLIRPRPTSIIVKIHCNTHDRLITSLFPLIRGKQLLICRARHKICQLAYLSVYPTVWAKKKFPSFYNSKAECSGYIGRLALVAIC